MTLLAPFKASIRDIDVSLWTEQCSRSRNNAPQGRCVLCFLKNHRSFCASCSRCRGVNSHKTTALFLSFFHLFFFFVSFAHSRAQDCVVKFVTFHCGLRYQNSVVDENPASADHRASESWKLLSPIKSPSVCFLLFSFFLHLYPTKDEREYIS